MKKTNLILTVLFLFLFLAQTNLSGQVPRPAVTVNPNTGAPTASVFVDGLSVLYYLGNKTEIAFARDYHSEIQVDVYTRRGGCQEYYSAPIKANERVQVGIQKTNPRDGGFFYQQGNRRPNGTYDSDQDFRYMPDFCSRDWHYQGTGPVPGVKEQPNLSKEHMAGKLVLKDAVFYTLKKSLSHGLRTNLEDGVKSDIGIVGRVLAADITAESNDTGLSLTIRGDGGTNENKALPKADGPYYIVVRTMPRSEFRGDHLHLLYDYIVRLPGNSSRFDFKYQQAETMWDIWEVCGTIRNLKGKQLKKPEHMRGNQRIQVRLATEYVCQTFGGCGEGVLPEFP